MGAAQKLQPNQISARLDELPTLPTVVYELSRVIGDPMSSTSDIEKIMSNDPAMTAKVLKLANSAYYAIPGGVSSLSRAIAYIGYDAINQLVLSTSIINALDSKASAIFDPVQFWKHSIGVAMASEATAKFVHHKNPSDLFTCGLVHDMGKIAIYILAPEDFAETLTVARDRGLTLHEAEIETGSSQHTFVGRELSEKWRLPMILRASIVYHHEKDMKRRGSLSPEMNQVVDIVLLANLLVHALKYGDSGHNKSVGAPRDVIERLRLDTDGLRGLVEEIKRALTSADAFLKIIGG